MLLTIGEIFENLRSDFSQNKLSRSQFVAFSPLHMQLICRFDSAHCIDKQISDDSLIQLYATHLPSSSPLTYTLR